MEKKEFAEQMQKLCDFFPNWKLDVDDPGVMKRWYQKFKDYSADKFEKAVDEYIDTREYPPTVAGLKKCLGYNEESVNPGGGATAEEIIELYGLEEG